jgi:hypothetical protein
MLDVVVTLRNLRENEELEFCSKTDKMSRANEELSRRTKRDGYPLSYYTDHDLSSLSEFTRAHHDVDDKEVLLARLRMMWDVETFF